MPGLTQQQVGYKPFRYPWAYDYWKKQQQIHWLPDEVPLADDVKDYVKSLSDKERNLLTHIFRFFTQSDVEVQDCYHRHYLSVFAPTEVAMMLTAFANMETVHIAAYSHLLDTLGLPEVEYSAFMKYKAMKDKHDFMQSYATRRPDGSIDPEGVARTLAGFGAFTEGLQLFASFAILLNFPRFNKMKGMGQIVTWSVRDETLHCEGVIRLYHEWLREHPEIDVAALHKDVLALCIKTVEHEDAFVDLAFELGDVEGLSAADIKKYLRYTANRRLRQLGIKSYYEGVDRNPIPWLDEILNGVEHVNFFEQRATEYSRGAAKGSWAEVWKEVDQAMIS